MIAAIPAATPEATFRLQCMRQTAENDPLPISFSTALWAIFHAIWYAKILAQRKYKLAKGASSEDEKGDSVAEPG